MPNTSKQLPLDLVLLFILTGIYLIESQPAGIYASTIISWLMWLGGIVAYGIAALWFQRHSGTAYVKFSHYIKLIVVVFLITSLIGVNIFSQIYLRQKTEPHLFVHDNPIQIELAVKNLVAGLNPYAVSYENTPLADWGRLTTLTGELIPNPALQHVIALPFHLVFSVPFYLVSTNLMGWYDQRVVYTLLFILTLILLYRLPRKLPDKLLALIVFAFNPLTVHDFVLGVNDIFVYFWILLAIWLLSRAQIKWSAIAVGLAVASKHFAWFLVPFWLLYIWLKNDELKTSNRLPELAKAVVTLLITVTLIVGPFIIWDPRAFFEDIYQYPAGTLPTSYPMSGFGFARLVIGSGAVASALDYFPFWKVQLAVGLPLLILLGWLQSKRNSVSTMMINYALLLVVLLFFSRFLHSNYLGFISMILITAYALSGDGQTIGSNSRKHETIVK